MLKVELLRFCPCNRAHDISGVVELKEGDTKVYTWEPCCGLPFITSVSGDANALRVDVSPSKDGMPTLTLFVERTSR